MISCIFRLDDMDRTELDGMRYDTMKGLLAKTAAMALDWMELR